MMNNGVICIAAYVSCCSVPLEMRTCPSLVLRQMGMPLHTVIVASVKSRAHRFQLKRISDTSRHVKAGM